MKEKFTTKEKAQLKKEAYTVFALTGKTFDDLRKDGFKFWSTWHKGEAFEKTKSTKGEIAVKMDIQGLGKTYAECEELARKEDAVILSASDYLEIMHQHHKKTGQYWLSNHWSWTNGRSSGGYLVSVGDFDADGAYVHSWRPGYVFSSLGVVLSRRPGFLGSLEKDVVVESDTDKDQTISKIKGLKENSLNSYSLKRNDVEIFWKGFDAAIDEVLTLYGKKTNILL
jgi:hypothetical protein